MKPNHVSCIGAILRADAARWHLLAIVDALALPDYWNGESVTFVTFAVLYTH